MCVYRLLLRKIWRGKPTFSGGRGQNGSPVVTKSELINTLAEQNPHLYLRDVERIVSTIFDEITDALSRGDRVELRGFGAFSIKRRGPRIGRNPRAAPGV